MRVLLATLPFVLLAAPLVGFADDPGKDDEALEFMKASTRVYEARTEAGALELRAEPLLRWTNPVSRVKHGTFFVWTRDGRPEVAVQVFTAANQDDLWLHEFQSLSETPFRFERSGQRVWTPKNAGVTPRPVPNVPAPADSPRGRLVQMRAIARRFEAIDDFEGESRWKLRLMTKPLLRYGTESSKVTDGAMFAFAHGTDPELLLLLEVRTAEGGDSRWHYSLAPMTGYALKVQLDREPVWSAEWRKPPFDVEAPFFTLVYEPESPGRNTP